VPTSLSLFVNVEPESLATPCPRDLRDVVRRAEATLRIFVEVNDRALTAEPAALVATVDRARELGWGVAVDDVGASRGCLAVLPLVHADVIKLDLRLLAEATPEHVAVVVSSVQRHVEATGASLVAEGVESESDVRLALALGAAYGQGHHLGKPAGLHARYTVPRAAVPVVGRLPDVPPAASPFELAAPGHVRRVDPGRLSWLLDLALRRCWSSTGRPLVLASLGEAESLTNDQRELLERLAVRTSLLVLFGAGVRSQPVRQVRGVRLHPGDPLEDERFVVVLTEESSTAILARRAADAPHLFDTVTTQLPDVVHSVTRHLIRRIPPPGLSNGAMPPEVSEPAAPVAGADTPSLARRARRWLG
jgi:hypothetical protein